MLVARQKGDSVVTANAPERHNIGRRDLQIIGAAHLAHSDIKPVQLRIMNIPLRQDLRKRAADKLPHPKLPL